MASNLASAFSQQTVENLTPQPVYDTDADGLIEITTLAQLDAIRHDPGGDGIPVDTGAIAYATAFPDVTRVVCDNSSGVCEGYELMADLDFFDTNEDGLVDTNDDTNGDGQVDAEDTAYWDNGAGWEPLGSGTTGFAATFDGNGHTIAHLYVNRGFTGGTVQRHLVYGRHPPHRCDRHAGGEQGEGRRVGRVQPRSHHRQLRHRMGGGREGGGRAGRGQ